MFFQMLAPQTGSDHKFGLWVSCDGRNFLYDVSNTRGKERRLYANIADKWQAGRWHHLAFVWETVPGESNDRVGVILDGKLVAARSDLDMTSETVSAAGPGALWIGRNSAGNLPYGLGGFVDDVIVLDDIPWEGWHVERGRQIFWPDHLPKFGPNQDPDQSVSLEGLVNVAPLAQVGSFPYCGGLRYVTDGVSGRVGPSDTAGQGLDLTADRALGEVTYASFPHRTTQGCYTFRFEPARRICAVRFLQYRAYAMSYRIDADSTGDGKPDRILVERRRFGRPNVWHTHRFEPVVAHVLRFTSLEETGRGAPCMVELEIYSREEDAKSADRVWPTPDPSVPVAHLDPVPPSPARPVPERDRLWLGATSCLWMFWQPHLDPDLTSPTFAAAFIKELQSMGMTYARLFVGSRPRNYFDVTLPNDFYRQRIPIADPIRGVVPWPSEVMFGYRRNVLKRFCAEMHKHGLKVLPILPRNAPPFDPRSGYFPMAQSDHHQPVRKFPCVTNADFYKEAFATLLREALVAGADGVDVCGDEYYCEVHDLGRISRDDPCIRLFKQRHGVPSIPTKVEDTLLYRRWVLFEYESTARMFKHQTDAVKQANPKAMTSTNISVAPLLFFNRRAFGIAYDMVGHIADIDCFGTDPYYRFDTVAHYQIPEWTKRLIGANKNRETIMILQGAGWGRASVVPFSDPIWITGGATSALMHGARHIDFYRLNYYWQDLPGKKTIADWIQMVHRLEALGLKHARVPRKIALLYSRASDDWWELKIQCQERKGPDAIESASGYVHHKAMMQLLCSHGHPYDLYYLDQVSTLREVTDYALLVLPFPYSIPKEAVAVIRQAVARGCRVLITNHLGEVDPEGEPHPAPLLQSLLSQEGVSYLDIDLLRDGAERGVQQRIADEITSLLGDDRPLYLDSHGKDVEAAVLEKGSSSKFVFAINWDTEPAEADLGVTVPPGPYRVRSFKVGSEALLKLRSSPAVSSKDLSRFRLPMPAHDVTVLHVEKATQR